MAVEGQRLRGRVSRSRDFRLDMGTVGAIIDVDVDGAIREMDLSHYQAEFSMQERLRKSYGRGARCSKD